MVPDSSLSESGKETSSQIGDGHTIVDLSTMVLHHPGNAGGFSQDTTSPRRPNDLANRTSIIMNQGVPVLVAWSISGNPLHQEEFLQGLQISCYHPGDQKLQFVVCKMVWLVCIKE